MSGDAELRQRKVLLLSVYREHGEAFVRELCAEAESDVCVVTVGETPVQLGLLAGDPRVTNGWGEVVETADGLVVLVRFMDAVSMDKLKAMARSLPQGAALPITAVLLREKDESDFKISCPSCRQKLWVRDADANKRGRCPNCKASFFLPSQAGHLKEQLLLSDAVPILLVERGDADSFRRALEGLVERLTGRIPTEPAVDADAIKKATVRVQLHNHQGA